MYSLQELLQDYQMFHSKFQQDNFITKRAGGTLYGQYKQALRELAGRVKGLRSLRYDYDMLRIEIDELTYKLHKLETRRWRRKPSYKIDKIRLRIRHKQSKLDETGRTIVETERELRRFYAQAVTIRQALEREYGTLTDEVKAKLDEDLWLYKAKEMAAVDLISQGRLRNTTYEMIAALPSHLKQSIVKDLKNGVLPEWYMTQDGARDFLNEHMATLEQYTINDALTAQLPLIGVV